MKTWETSPRHFRFSTIFDDENKKKRSPLEYVAHTFSTQNNKYTRFGLIFGGRSPREPHPDFWYNFILGFFELCAFSYLMNAGMFQYIGGWLLFKIAGQWNTWKESRYAINRFFIATALQLIFCYACLAHCPPLQQKDVPKVDSVCK